MRGTWLPLKWTNFRTPFEGRSREENISTSIPKKRKINSLILGKNRKAQRARQEASPTPQSPSPKRVKSSTKSPEEPLSSKVELEIEETRSKIEIKVFHHSGPKNYFLQDGPVTLRPFENSYAKGGFGVRCSQDGQYVGLIASGEETLCRKLLV